MLFVYSEIMGNVEPYNRWDGDILSLLDFPMESLEGGDDDNVFVGDWDSINYGPIPSHDTASHVWKQEQTNSDLKTQSPVSVIESNGSTLSSSGKIKRARSKRARPSGLSPWLLMSPLFAKTLSPEPSVAKKSIDNMDSDTKRCSHCQVTQTPQWRGGPMGPKTLCNACGVRYRSGRLLPEYRPAASPTFVSSLHSNSHKKVVEMRNRVPKEQQDSM